MPPREGGLSVLRETQQSSSGALSPPAASRNAFGGAMPLSTAAPRPTRVRTSQPAARPRLNAVGPVGASSVTSLGAREGDRAGAIAARAAGSQFGPSLSWCPLNTSSGAHLATNPEVSPLKSLSCAGRGGGGSWAGWDESTSSVMVIRGALAENRRFPRSSQLPGGHRPRHGRSDRCRGCCSSAEQPSPSERPQRPANTRAVWSGRSRARARSCGFRRASCFSDLRRG